MTGADVFSVCSLAYSQALHRQLVLLLYHYDYFLLIQFYFYQVELVKQVLSSDSDVDLDEELE